MVLNEASPGWHRITTHARLYNDYVKEYTSRDIKQPEHRLDAISGVLQLYYYRQTTIFRLIWPS